MLQKRMCFLFIVLLLSGVCFADVVFTVSDNGDGTTDWAVSGTGSTLGSTVASNLLIFNFPEFVTGSLVISTTGTWSFAGHNSDDERAGSASPDRIIFSFDSDIGVGEDLTTFSGVVTFNVDFATFNLSTPVISNGGGAESIFGKATIQAAGVPEPSTYLLLLTIVGVMFYRRKRAQR